MASGAQQPPPPQAGQQHSGVAHGAKSRQLQSTPPRRDWLLGGLVAGLTVIALLIVVNVFGARPTNVANAPSPSQSPTESPLSSLPVFVQDTPTPIPLPTATPSPSPSPLPSPSPFPSPTMLPTPTLPPTPTPTPTPTATPTPTPTPTPGGTPTLAPSPTSTPAPTPSPVVELVITAPQDGATLRSNPVVIKGRAPPGATITHDIPLGFDEHATADAQGRWSFTETLAQGENTFVFRIGDDRSTEQTITLVYSPV